MSLLPWGSTYRVVPRITSLDTAIEWKDKGLQALKQMREVWVDGIPPATRFDSGSWEYGAISVYYDAHYQMGLYILTLALELQRGVSATTFGPYAQALRESVELLDEVMVIS